MFSIRFKISTDLQTVFEIEESEFYLTLSTLFNTLPESGIHKFQELERQFVPVFYHAAQPARHKILHYTIGYVYSFSSSHSKEWFVDSHLNLSSVRIVKVKGLDGFDIHRVWVGLQEQGDVLVVQGQLVAQDVNVVAHNLGTMGII